MTQIWPEDQPLWLIGCGNMAGAMLARWLQVGVPREAITVVRPSGQVPAPGVRTLTSIPAAPPPRLVLLAVKPQRLDEVAPELAPVIGPDTLLLSILAGTELASLQARFPAAGAIVRAMPNMPVSIGRGTVALHGEPRAFSDELARLLGALGTVEWIAQEAHFGAVTALAGSGPAFVFRFIEALAHGAEKLGMSRDQALRLATATVDGAAGLALSSSEDPALLIERVASAGGTTRAGLDVLDAAGSLEELVARTLRAAEQRSRELAVDTR